MNPWVHFLIPFINNIQMVNVRVKTINYKQIWWIENSDVGEDSFEWIKNKEQISVLDNRWLPIGIEMTILYQLDQLQVAETIVKYGYSWDEKLVNPTVREVVRDVLWEYEAEIIPEKRQEMATKIKTMIQEKFKNTMVSVADVQLRNIALPTQVQEKIMQVQIAKQEAQRQQYELEKANKEKEIIEVKAQAEANRQIEEAKWTAEAIKLQATAQAEANKKLSESLTKELIQYKFIDGWDWVLPKVNWTQWNILQLPESFLN